MIRVATYTTGRKVQETTLENLNTLRAIAWVDVVDPSVEELQMIREKLDIPFSELKHTMDQKESSRVRSEQNYTLIIFNGVKGEKTKAVLTPIGFIMTKRVLVTIRKESLGVIDQIDVNADVFTNIMRQGLDILLYTILYRIVKDAAMLLESVEEDIDEIETEALKVNNKKVTEKLFDVKKMLIYMRKSLVGNRMVVNYLRKEEQLIRNKGLFHDVEVELIQLIDQLEVYDEKLGTVIDICLTASANRANDVMKTFGIFAAMMLVPMLITGLYGMNVILPLQGHQNAFWIIMLIIIISVTIMLLMFKWKKWT